jgi:hypothetical protein
MPLEYESEAVTTIGRVMILVFTVHVAPFKSTQRMGRLRFPTRGLLLSLATPCLGRVQPSDRSRDSSVGIATGYGMYD